MRQITIFFDGSCEPFNPGGIGTIGYVIEGLEDGPVLGSEFVGSGQGMTSNVAEYIALGKALRFLSDSGKILKADRIVIKGNSKLVVNQLDLSWNCNVDRLRVLRDRCRDILANMRARWVTQWIARDENELADKLSQDAYVKHTGKAYPQRRRGSR